MPTPHSIFSLLLLLPSALSLQPSSVPSSPPSEDSLRQRISLALADANALDEKNALRFGTDDNFLLRPGLLADRKSRVITLSAHATGLSGNDPIEFFLIGPASGKDYESLAVSFAKPSDVRAALEFLGMPPGRPVNYAKSHFIPKGERVRMTFRWEEPSPDGNVSQRSARVEELLLLRDPGGKPSDRTLPLVGLVFTGGRFLPPEAPGQLPRFLGDLGDPGAIATNYNDPTTVLDFPAFARQSEVYRTRVINPAAQLAPGQPLTITLEPDRQPDAPPRVLDLALTVSGAATSDLKDLAFTLTPAGGTPLTTSAPAADLLAALTQLATDHREPFVTVLPSPDLPLSTVRKLYALLSALQTDNGIRLEPPSGISPAHPYFESFLPDEARRDPAKRLWQPVELRLSANGTATLRDYQDNNLAAPGDPRFTSQDTPIPTPADLETLLAARQDQRRPLAIYAPANLPYQSLLKWTPPALEQDWILWIYLE